MLRSSKNNYLEPNVGKLNILSNLIAEVTPYAARVIAQRGVDVSLLHKQRTLERMGVKRANQIGTGVVE